MSNKDNFNYLGLARCTFFFAYIQLKYKKLGVGDFYLS